MSETFENEELEEIVEENILKKSNKINKRKVKRVFKGLFGFAIFVSLIAGGLQYVSYKVDKAEDALNVKNISGPESSIEAIARNYEDLDTIFLEILVRTDKEYSGIIEIGGELYGDNKEEIQFFNAIEKNDNASVDIDGNPLIIQDGKGRIFADKAENDIVTLHPKGDISEQKFGLVEVETDNGPVYEIGLKPKA